MDRSFHGNAQNSIYPFFTILRMFGGEEKSTYCGNIVDMYNWNIWKLKNEVVFNNSIVNIERVVNSIKMRVWNWIAIKEASVTGFSISLWLGDPWQYLNAV